MRPNPLEQRFMLKLYMPGKCPNLGSNMMYDARALVAPMDPVIHQTRLMCVRRRQHPAPLDGFLHAEFGSGDGRPIRQQGPCRCLFTILMLLPLTST